jgi:hypothetical protein
LQSSLIDLLAPLHVEEVKLGTSSMLPLFLRLSGIAFALLELATAASARPSCAVVGDSNAVGAGQYMRVCKTNAKIGILSSAVIARVDPFADVNVNLESIRSRASRVIWILPIDARARAEVQAVATAHADPVVSFVPAGDHVHPLSEVDLARSIAAVMRARLGGSVVGQISRPID